MSPAASDGFPANGARAFHGETNRGTRRTAEAFHRGAETDLGG